MAYDLIKISALPEATPDESQDIVVGVGDYAKRINYGDVKADMVGTSPTYTTDTEPYLMRRTAHTGVVGKCALNKVVGGSVAWNQLVPNTGKATTTTNGITFTVLSDGRISLSGTATADASFVYGRLDFIANHRYAVVGIPSGGGASTYYARAIYSTHYTDGIVMQTASDYYTSQIIVKSGATVNGVIFNLMCIDLTLMFGSTIADYLSSLGTTVGLAKLREWGFDLDSYHAYDAGSIQSVQATAHVTTGFNAWDEEWEVGSYDPTTGAKTTASDRIRSKNYIPVLPSTAYGHNVGMYVYEYDGNKQYLSRTDWGLSSTFTTSAKTRYVTFISYSSYGTTYNNNICINISKTSGSPKNGDYVAYNGHTYPLDTSLILRGYPVTSSGKLQYEGDIYESNGLITRKYGVVDLGTMNWQTTNPQLGIYWFNNNERQRINMAWVANNVVLKAVCSKYYAVSDEARSGSDRVPYSMWWNQSSKFFGVCDLALANSTAAQFKAAMSGIYLVYPLETPSTESSTAYQRIQTVDPDGTESFTVSNPVPVGHETQTPDNILAALEWLGE